MNERTLRLPLPAKHGEITLPVGLGVEGFQRLKKKMSMLLDIYEEDIVGEMKGPIIAFAKEIERAERTQAKIEGEHQALPTRQGYRPTHGG